MLLCLCAVCACAVAGCAAEAPPLEELPLRDTLGAEPEAVAALGDAARLVLAERFEGALAEEHEDVVAPVDELVPWPEVELRHADAELEDRGDDALVASVLVSDDEAVHLLPWEVTGSHDPTSLPELGGPTAASTALLEEVALETRAGEILAELMAEHGAARLVRVIGWPAGAVVHGDALYVNAAWLVAMSPFSDAPAVVPPTVGEPAKRPLALGFNPYRLPGSLAVCTDDVRKHCSCVESGTCADEPPIDARFATAAEECAWLASNPIHPDVLCILWLMSIEAIADCMPDECQVGSIEDAVRVASDEFCRGALDNCIVGKRAVPSDGCDCDDDCGPDCGSPDCSSPDCSSCEQSCDSCEQSCDSANQSCDSTSDSCNDTCNKTCTVAPARKHGSTFVWLLAPLAYLFWRTRRLA